MSFSVVYTRAKCGIDAPLVSVETHLSNGLPSLSIVGMPTTAVKESKDRVRSAIINSHFEFPNRRITVNLAPADLPKNGGRFDLPIALGILAASGQVPVDVLCEYEFIGELALNGNLRAIDGVLPAAIKSTEQGRAIVVPKDNTIEATICKNARVFAPENLLQLSAHLHQREAMSPAEAIEAVPANGKVAPDLKDVKGQHQARRALEIAAAGEHNILFSGPPGTGKTMLASRLAGILPPLSDSEILEVATVYSVQRSSANTVPYQLDRQRPFRAAHHTASAVALVGGGSNPGPGEISLAHKGVLFLDEFPEFQRRVLEVLREPLESGEIMISRANRQVCFPANFQLIAAMNPCPCGYLGDLQRHCCCTPDQIQRYRDRVSGPLLDRIDLQLNINRLPVGTLSNRKDQPEASAVVQQRVMQSRTRQIERANKANAQLNNEDIAQYCALSRENELLLEQAVDRLKLSPRAYHRILRVARTIADLEDQSNIGENHLSEAISYRAMDKDPF